MYPKTIQNFEADFQGLSFRGKIINTNNLLIKKFAIQTKSASNQNELFSRIPLGKVYILFLFGICYATGIINGGWLKNFVYFLKINKIVILRKCYESVISHHLRATFKQQYNCFKGR